MSSFESFLKDMVRAVSVWSVPQANYQDIALADAVVTAAHGLLHDGTPSPGDIVLANTMRSLHKEFPAKPIIPQEPVALAAPEITYVAIARPPKNNLIGTSNMRWNSRTVAEFQADACRSLFPTKELITVAMIATPGSQPRFEWELERCGLKVVVVPVPPFTAECYNHPDSIYWYGRGGVWRYLLVEATRGRLHYLSYWLGK